MAVAGLTIIISLVGVLTGLTVHQATRQFPLWQLMPVRMAITAQLRLLPQANARRGPTSPSPDKMIWPIAFPLLLENILFRVSMQLAVTARLATTVPKSLLPLHKYPVPSAIIEQTPVPAAKMIVPSALQATIALRDHLLGFPARGVTTVGQALMCLNLVQ